MIGLYIRSSEKLDLIEEKDAFVSNLLKAIFQIKARHTKNINI